MPVSEDALQRVEANPQTRDRRDRMLLRRYGERPTRELREQVVERFTPLARSLASRYRMHGEPIEDLIQVACEGLIRAVDGFDHRRGPRFSSYATPVILGTLRHYFRDSTNPVHVTRGLGERIQKVRNADRGLTGEGFRGDRISTLAKRAGLSEEQVSEALQAEVERWPVSVDRERRGPEGADAGTLLETLGGADPAFEKAESSQAANAVTLEPREFSVLRLRFGRGMTQREVGASLGISQMQVSRVQRRALGRLLAALRGHQPDAGRQGSVSERASRSDCVSGRPPAAARLRG